MREQIGFDLDRPVDGVMTMPTAASQKVLDRYYTPISENAMKKIKSKLNKLSKQEQQIDMKLADEELAFLRKNPDFETGYQILSDGERAHLHLVLVAQQDYRALDNLEYVMSFK